MTTEEGRKKGANEGSIVLRLVRHAESLHNISTVAEYGDQGNDPSLFDAPLSMNGEAQARNLAISDSELLTTANLVVSSPLTRALQTLHLMTTQEVLEALKIEVWPVMTEHLTASCDIGSSPSALSEKFPYFDFSALAPVWWYIDAETSPRNPDHSRCRFRDFGFFEPMEAFEARVDTFVQTIRERAELSQGGGAEEKERESNKESPYVVTCFGHSDFFDKLCERHLGLADRWLRNAEVLCVELPRSK